MKPHHIIATLRTEVPDEQFSVDSFCRILRISRSRLHTILTVNCGEKPVNLLRRRRVETIIECIASYPEAFASATLSDIARRGSFHDVKPLISAFKQFLGEHPLEWRNSYLTLLPEERERKYIETLHTLWAGLPADLPAIDSFRRT